MEFTGIRSFSVRLFFFTGSATALAGVYVFAAFGARDVLCTLAYASTHTRTSISLRIESVQHYALHHQTLLKLQLKMQRPGLFHGTRPSWCSLKYSTSSSCGCCVHMPTPLLFVLFSKGVRCIVDCQLFAGCAVVSYMFRRLLRSLIDRHPFITCGSSSRLSANP